MRVKHPSVDGLERSLLPSQVDAWLSAGWLPVDAPEVVSEPVEEPEPEAVEVEEAPAPIGPVEAPHSSRKRLPRKG